MKIYLRFRSVSIYVLTVLLALSFPLSVYAEDVPQPVNPDTAVAAQPTPEEETAAPKPTETTTDTSPAPSAPSPEKTDDSAASTQSTPSTPDAAAAPVQVDNTQTATSTSGDATVAKNTTAGSAQSGDAKADTTVAAIVNSQTDLAKAGTFTKDVTGTVFGDITLEPLISNSLQNGSGTTFVPIYYVPSATAPMIGANQTIVVGAKSGDAAVLDNSQAGDAITGTAIAHVNSITIANSTLQSQGAFIGTVNILGDLDGDILISPSFLPSLVNANPFASGTSSAPALGTDVKVNTAVLLGATSGNAEVSDNSKAGNAASGDASTNLLAYALVGNQLTANKGLLVFVNVLGQWVGSIVASPDGATTAFLASDVTHQGVVPVAVIDGAADITNNIQVTAKSGDALVARNSAAGSALSGKAMASANILTMINNTMDLSGWLGVLFINVFGNWHGSFGVDTANGNLPSTGSPVPIAVPVVMAAAPPASAFASSTSPILRTSSAPTLVIPGNAPEDQNPTVSQQASDDTSDSHHPAVLGDTTQFNGPSSSSKLPLMTIFALAATALGALLYAARSLRQRFAEA